MSLELKGFKEKAIANHCSDGEPFLFILSLKLIDFKFCLKIYSWMIRAFFVQTRIVLNLSNCFVFRYNELQDPTYQYKIDIGHFMVRWRLSVIMKSRILLFSSPFLLFLFFVFVCVCVCVCLPSLPPSLPFFNFFIHSFFYFLHLFHSF